MTQLRGAMFEPAINEWRESVHKKSGAHYNVYAFNGRPLKSGEFLKMGFVPDHLNFFLFSTSGVHGSYFTLEEIETAWDITDQDADDYEGREITVLLVQPRTVTLTYGNIEIESLEHLQVLKTIRALSWAVVADIGKP